MTFKTEFTLKMNSADIKHILMSKSFQNHNVWVYFRLDAIGRNTGWHQAYDKYSVGRRTRANEKVIQAELTQANKELKALRNKRL